MPAHADIPVVLIAFTRQIVARDALFRVVPRNRHAVWHNGRDVLALLKAEPPIFKVRCLRPSWTRRLTSPATACSAHNCHRVARSTCHSSDEYAYYAHI